MSDAPQPDFAAIDRFVVMVLAMLCASVAMQFTSRVHVWGDDFAGYVLQARAIDHHGLHAEIEESARLLAVSDDAVGPSAYPWGFPALLWLNAQVTGWGLNDLKFVGIISMAVLAGATYLLARSYLGRAGSVAATLVLVLQPPVVRAADHVESDLPGLAITAVALVVMHRLSRPAPRLASMRLWLVTGAAMLIVGAYAIRSYGAFLAVSMFTQLVVAARYAPTAQRRARMAEVVTLTILTSLLLVLCRWLLPDGSLVNVQYLSHEPVLLGQRILAVTESFAEFVPFSLLRHEHLLPPVMAAACGLLTLWLMSRGVWHHRRMAWGLVVFGVLNVALVAALPVRGVTRYLFPMLFPVVILSAAGLAHTMQRMTATRGLDTVRVKRFSWMMSVAAAAVMLVSLMQSFRGPVEGLASGPLTVTSDSLFAFVRAHIPDNTPVAFFKPRALRMFTGREGVAITKVRNLARVRFVILDKRADDALYQKVWQVPRDSVEHFDGGRFRTQYENSQFVVLGPGTP